MSKTADLVFDNNPKTRSFTRQYQKEAVAAAPVIEVLMQDPESPIVGQMWIVDVTV